jgi:hypothetical protein
MLAADLPLGVDIIAAESPGHYASEEHIARILDRLGKPAAAELVREKRLTTKSIRSGDIVEILATEYIDEKTDYEAPIEWLRRKDHRNMALRGATKPVWRIGGAASAVNLKFLSYRRESA